MVCKWRHGTCLWSSEAALRDLGDRRQSVSRQPSFTLSEWTDIQEDLLDLDPEPETPVFEMGNDSKPEGDAITLTVTPVGLQERLAWQTYMKIIICISKVYTVCMQFKSTFTTSTCLYMDKHVCTCLIPCLFHRRGSNVSLTLDMCTPGCTEPYGYGAQLSPRDKTAQEYLRQGTHILTPAVLHVRAMDDESLQAEFYVSATTAAHPPTRCRLTDTHR